MTFGSFSRRLVLLAAALSSTFWLAACGGDDGDGNSGSGGTTNLRAVNLTTDLPSLDLYTGDTRRFSALAPDALATSVGFEANTYTVGVRRAGENTTLYSDSFTLSRDRNYTAVITGRESSLLVRTIPENEDTNGIAAGKFRVRIYNLTGDTAGIDVFITPPGTDLNGATPTARFTSATLTDFVEFDTATSYQLRVTNLGKPAEIRLDVALTGRADKNFHTLVLTSGLGGTLINGTLIAQGGGATALKTGKARVRLAAGVAGAGSVAATVGGTSVGIGALLSPSVGTYQEVDAGSRALAVSVNGTVVSNATRDFTAGADYTVLTTGSAAAPTITVLSDDNRLPAASSQAKLRLINGVSGSQPMSLLLDFAPLIGDTAADTASAYFAVTSAGSGRVRVNALNGSMLFEQTGLPLLQPMGVYTVFMLGGNAQPYGELRKDR